MDDFRLLLLIVAGFSVVQSLFGVGLLVFGTPALMLLGYPFAETLAYLLPSSLSISLMQSVGGRAHIQELRRNLLRYCIPALVLGLALVLSSPVLLDLRGLVGGVLLLAAATRSSSTIQTWLASVLEQFTPLYLIVMGFVHGVSNMGGGFLTIYVSTLYSEKDAIRANIAFGYLVIVLSQIAVLLLLDPAAFHVECLVLAATAVTVYLTIGRSIYVRSSSATYQRLITLLMFAYGLALLVPEWL